MATRTKKAEMPRIEEFLATALRRFSQHGYAATSTRDICSDVGLVPSAMYNYFPSKESVLLAIEEREMVQMQAGLDALLHNSADDPPLTRFRVALRFILSSALRRQQAWRLMAEMLRSLSNRSKARVVARRDHFQNALRNLMDEAIASGDLSPRDTHLATLYIFGIAEGMSGWYRASGETDLDLLVRDSEQFCLQALQEMKPLK